MRNNVFNKEFYRDLYVTFRRLFMRLLNAIAGKVEDDGE